MKDRLEQIKKEAIEAIRVSDVPEKLNDVRVRFLGKKGELTAVLKGMKDVAPEERPKVGQMVNETRAAIEQFLEETKTKMERAIREERLKKEVIDVTLPAKKNNVGHRHPNTIALEEVERIFVGMGYEVVEGPEVEYDEYNFEKLNIPADHPAKDEQDTFYINKEILLRTQTSPVQARVM
ncbi:MAG: phenylalanine--tRNA ligase subunit alpha, partial [Ruminococcus sp.]|nr:phenylalanine--tRNA ligase subunit alpha [Ruminococcus sp.]